MNFYNPYFPIISPLPVSALKGSYPLEALTNPLLASYGSYHINPPISLNQKRPLLSSMNSDLDEIESSLGEPTKKWKKDEQTQNILKANQFHSSNYLERSTNQFKIQAKNNKPEIINLEAEEDCLVLDESPAQDLQQVDNSIRELYPKGKQDTCNTKQISALKGLEFANQKINLWNNILSARLLSTPNFHPLHLANPMELYPTYPQGFNLPGWCQNHILERFLTQREQLQDNLQRLTPVQKSPLRMNDVILIEDDESTSSQMQNREDQIEQQNSNEKEVSKFEEPEKIIVSPSSIKEPKEISNALNQSPKDESEEEIIERYQNFRLRMVNKTDHYAIIPKFELGVSSKKRKTARKPKPMWNPNHIKSCSYEKCFEEVEKAVGMEITDEVKVIRTLKNFGGDLEVIIKEIKRNKAHYKNYFRVKKIERVRNPYSFS